MLDAVPGDILAEVLTAEQARTDGLARGDVRFLMRSGLWTRVRRGVYADAPVPSAVPELLHVRTAAAHVALHEAGVCSHETAAQLYGLPVRPVERVILTMPPSRRSHRDFDGVHLHRAGLPDSHLALVHGLPTTSVARTLVDLARNRRFAEGLVPLDYALHHHLVARSQLDAVLRDCRRWPGNRRAGEVIGFGHADCESPLESLGRLCLHRFGVAPPVLQREVVLSDGRRTRVDYWWPEGVVGEADGMAKYVDASVLRAEKLRQEGLERLGLTVVRFTWADVTLRAAETAARFAAALASKQAAPPHFAP